MLTYLRGVRARRRALAATLDGWAALGDKPEYTTLARYNGERARGLVHTTAYDSYMWDVQARFNAERDRLVRGC